MITKEDKFLLKHIIDESGVNNLLRVIALICFEKSKRNDELKGTRKISAEWTQTGNKVLQSAQYIENKFS